jgi:hypothetical protein
VRGSERHLLVTVQPSDNHLLVGGVAFANVAFAVLHRRLGLSVHPPWRKNGPWALALALPVAIWLHLLFIATRGHRETLYGWAVLSLWPLAVSLMPFLLARIAMRYSAAIYYMIMLPLTIVGWLSAAFVVWCTMDG